MLRHLSQPRFLWFQIGIAAILAWGPLLLVGATSLCSAEYPINAPEFCTLTACPETPRQHANAWTSLSAFKNEGSAAEISNQPIERNEMVPAGEDFIPGWPRTKPANILVAADPKTPPKPKEESKRPGFFGGMPNEVQPLSVPDLRDHNPEHDFAWDLYRHIASSSTQNMVFSPLATDAAFGLLAQGADGETYLEFAKVFGYANRDEPAKRLDAFMKLSKRGRGKDAPTVMAATGLFTQSGLVLLSEYSKFAKKHAANVEHVNFRHKDTVRRINQWIAKTTAGNISGGVDAQRLDKETLALSVSAIYFRASWKAEFERSETKSHLFKPDGGDEFRTAMMQKKFRVLYASTDDYQAVRLPYTNSKFTATILIPQKGKVLADIERHFCSEFFVELEEFWQSPGSECNVRVSVPRFSINSDIELQPAHQSQGLSLAFRSDADFSRLTSAKPMFLTDAFQQTSIEVDEVGTVAKAVTSVGGGFGGGRFIPRTCDDFIADRSFLFIVHDGEGQIPTFIAKVNKPEKWKDKD